MGARGPAKVYPHQVTVRINDETNEFLEKFSTAYGKVRSDSARLLLEHGIKALTGRLLEATQEALDQAVGDVYAETFGAADKDKTKAAATRQTRRR